MVKNTPRTDGIMSAGNATQKLLNNDNYKVEIYQTKIGRFVDKLHY